MSNLTDYFVTAAGSILSAFGEDFTVTVPGKDPYSVKGVFEDLPEQTMDGIPVLVRTPYVFFKNADTDGQLTQQNTRILREISQKSYRIVEPLRDAASSTTYVIEEVRD